MGYQAGPHLAEYVGDSPTNRQDPMGLLDYLFLPEYSVLPPPSPDGICCQVKSDLKCAGCSCDDIKSLFNAAKSHSVPLGRNPCHRWADSFITAQNKKPSSCYSLKKAEWHYLLYDWPPFSWSPFGKLGHGAVRVIMCDRTVFYLDNGLWGRNEYGSFWPGDIPPTVVPDL